jgi:hypothetical protein
MLADAASLRDCSNLFAASQQASRFRSFKTADFTGIQTDPSLQSDSTKKLRDFVSLRCKRTIGYYRDGTHAKVDCRGKCARNSFNSIINSVKRHHPQSDADLII